MRAAVPVVAVSSKNLVFFVKGSLKFCLKIISFCEGGATLVLAATKRRYGVFLKYRETFRILKKLYRFQIMIMGF